MKTTATQVKGGSHQEKNFSAIANPDGTITVRVDFDWCGLSNENKPMVACTQHEWILQNEPNERFAKIKKMEVTQLKPFQIVEG